MTRRLPLLDDRGDARGRRVVFLSHCLLNENVRYPGGACDACCVRSIVDACLRAGVGMVQMPCPEQQAWGGVQKKWMLMACGMDRGPLRRVRSAAIALFLRRTARTYRQLARRVAGEIQDYLAAGYSVVGVVGVDASPSCGVSRTLDIGAAVRDMSRTERGAWTARRMNDLVRRRVVAGEGMFLGALRKELARRRVDVPLVAHDLVAELDAQEPGLVAKWLLGGRLNDERARR